MIIWATSEDGLSWNGSMPPEIRELIADLQRAGFDNIGGKGSHRNFVHPATGTRVTVSGNLGRDARPYQIKDVRIAIEESEQ